MMEEEMGVSNLSVLQMARGKLGWLAQRQVVLAGNIANADTPNFLAKDLKALDFKKVLNARAGSAGTMMRTSAKHMTAAGSAAQRVGTTTNRQPYEVSANGNGVILEEQLMNLSNTNVQYQLTTNIYKKQLGMLRMALASNNR
jgi:flagellar basal-body rod protein FlgB